MVYNINFKKVRGLWKIGLFFLILGIILLLIVGGIGISNINKKFSLDGEVTAYNIEWKEHIDDEGTLLYSPIYYYEVDGKEYTCFSNASSNNKSAKGIVYYDTTNPTKCMTDFENTISMFFIAFIIIPIILIVIAIILIINYTKKKNLINQLASSGTLIKGIPCELVNSNIKVNNIYLKCISINYQFPDGVTRNLKSSALKQNEIKYNCNICDLLYDTNNYNNYFIDYEITTTGSGNPNILYYQNPNSNTASYNNMEPNSYNPNNKF